VVDLDGVPLGEHAAALQRELEQLKRALDDPNTPLDFEAEQPADGSNDAEPPTDAEPLTDAEHAPDA
jgi:hypothetical protein